MSSTSGDAQGPPAPAEPEFAALDPLQRWRGPAIALALGAMLFFLLTPGPMPPLNQIAWRSPSPGLRLAGISQAFSEYAIHSELGELTLELWLERGFHPSVANQEIVSFYDEQELRPLVLGQYPGGFILRGRADNPSADPRFDRYLDIDRVGLHAPGDLDHLALTVGIEGARLHVNGRATRLNLPKTRAQPGVRFGGHLLLGSSTTGWSAWRGSVLRIALYERILDETELLAHATGIEGAELDEAILQDPSVLALYALREGHGRRARSSAAGAPDLQLPERVRQPTRSRLLTTHRFSSGKQRWLVGDIARNVAGFVPLGLMVAWKRRRGLALAILVGFALSLGVELLQVWIPGRASSMFDLVSNTIGAMLGGMVALPFARRARP